MVPRSHTASAALAPPPDSLETPGP